MLLATSSVLVAVVTAARCEHLVVAPRAFALALVPFLEHRRSASHHLDGSEFVALEDALAGREGRDDAERLKRYLHDRWKTDGVRSCLLVGDCDVLPMRSMTLDRATAPAFNWAFYPSDLYYADVAAADGSFDDWNAGCQGFHGRYYGEVHGETNKGGVINFDRIDYRPDVAVGRWPVSTPEEAAAIARKTIAYERTFDGTESGPDRIAFFAVGGWVDVRDRVRAWAKRLSERADVTVCAHDSETGPAPDEASMRATLERSPRWVFHTGHGQPWGWERCLTAATIDGVGQGPLLPILVSAGCSTSEVMTQAPYQPYTDACGVDHVGTNAGEVFTSPPPPPNVYQRTVGNTTSMSETLVRLDGRGAIATIGCVTGSQPAAVSLLDGLTEAIVEDTDTLGQCWNVALRRYCEIERLDELVPTESWYPPSIYFQGMKFILLGDPGLRVR